MPREESYEAQNAREAMLRKLADEERAEFRERQLRKYKEISEKAKGEEQT